MFDAGMLSRANAGRNIENGYLRRECSFLLCGIDGARALTMLSFSLEFIFGAVELCTQAGLFHEERNDIEEI